MKCSKPASAEEGIALARSEMPDLILMDLSLPGMDGLTATRHLCADDSTAQIPIVVLTANAMKGDEERAREAGASGYVAKPIDTRAFPEQIKSFLKGWCLMTTLEAYARINTPAAYFSGGR